MIFYYPLENEVNEGLVAVKWLFALFLVLFAATSIAVIAGRLQPLPEPLRSLHLTDCRPPCWIGITPGQTTFEDAKQRIREVYGYFGEKEYEVFTYIPGQRGVLNKVSIFSYDANTVSHISFDFIYDPMTKWELLELLGNPSILAVGDDGGGYSLRYGVEWEIVSLNGDLPSYSCKNEIWAMTFHSVGIRDPLFEAGESRWTGYRSFLKEMGCIGDEFLR